MHMGLRAQTGSVLSCRAKDKGELGMLLLPTRAALFSGLFREHLFLSQVLAAFPSISSGRVLKKKTNPTGLFSVSFLSQLRNFVPFELFRYPLPFMGGVTGLPQ